MHRLMLVEDEDHLRSYMLQCVPWEKLGISHIRGAACGEEAMAVFPAFAPDILLTDIRMPGMSGTELAAAMLCAQPDLRVIFMSAYSEAEYLRSALRMGSVDYLFKPVQLNDLEEAVARATASLQKMRRDQGSARLVESYQEQLLKPLLARLLMGDEPMEQLSRGLETLPIRDEKGIYLAVRLYPLPELTKDLYDGCVRLLSLSGFAYCRLVPLGGAGQALLCCFEKAPGQGEVENALVRLSTYLQANGLVSVKAEASRPCLGLEGLYGFAAGGEGGAKPRDGGTGLLKRPRVSALCGQMISLIHERYGDHSFGAGSLAKELHYTNAYVCTVFKQKYGMTIHDYMNLYRIAKAKELLQNTEDSLASIAERVGYENDSYFSRVFKKSEGISPSDYRRGRKG